MQFRNIKTVYMHIGTMKTATSSIQDTLYQNQEILKKNNFLYPSELRSNHSTDFNRLFNINEYKSDTSHKLGIDKNKIKILNNETIDKIQKSLTNNNCQNVIFSAETLSFLTLKEFKGLKKFFADLFPEALLKIVICFRNPEEFYASLLSEWEKKGKISDYSIKQRAMATLLPDLHSVFGQKNVIDYSFHDACSDKFGPVGYFCEKIGIKKQIINKIKFIKSNERISINAIDIIKFFNNKLPILSNNKMNYGRFHLDHFEFESLSGESYQASIIDFPQLDRSYMNKEVDWFKKKYGGNLKSRSNNKQVINFNKDFFLRIKEIYPNITPVLKKLTYEYLNSKKTEKTLDADSKNNIDKLIEWIDENNKFISENSLKKIIDYQSKEYLNDEAYKRYLLKKLKNNKIEVFDIFKSISTFLNYYSMKEDSNFFHTKANFYHDNNIHSQNTLDIDKRLTHQLLKKFAKDQIRLANFLRDISKFLENFGMSNSSAYFLKKAKMYNPRLIQINNSPQIQQENKTRPNLNLLKQSGFINSVKKIFKK